MNIKWLGLTEYCELNILKNRECMRFKHIRGVKMKIVLLFISPNTTTKMATNKIKQILLKNGHIVTLLNIGKENNRDFKNIDFSIFKEVDLIGIGTPIYHLTIIEPMKKFLDFGLSKIKKQNPRINAFIYFTYSGITSGKALYHSVKLLKQNEISLVGAAKLKAPHFREACSYPNKTATKVIEEYMEKLIQKNFKTIRWKEVYKVARKRKIIVNAIYPFSKKIGKIREQKITILKDKCIGCKKCVKECVVNAIKFDSYISIDDKKCIHCYHCRTICPVEAIKCDIDKVYKIIELNKKIVGMEFPQNDILV